MLPIVVPAHFRIIAHRGASAYAPENTHASFQLATKMGIREIETDAQLSSDGQVVLCHDLTLARYGHGEQVVESLPASELTQLDMGSWFSPFLYGGERLFTLDQLLQQFGNQFLHHIELKGKAPGLAAAVAERIAAHNLAERVFITSFDATQLERMRAAAPELRLGWLVRRIDDEALRRAEALGLYQLCPQAEGVTPEVVAQARTVTPEVRAWGLSGSRQQVIQLIHQVIDSGCDGTTIDWPDWLTHAQ